VAANPGHFAYFAAGDDHLIETPSFDTIILNHLHDMKTGFVYGADGLMNEFLPTAGAMTGNVIEALGYMSLPELIHLYVDNFWKDLFSEIGKLKYNPDLKISHLHPSGGFTAWDEQYKEVNDPAMYAHDSEAYEQYKTTRFAEDVQKLRNLL
jgi:GT2 family glycosyltransferase